jgi:uncharacterized protein YcfL
MKKLLPFVLITSLGLVACSSNQPVTNKQDRQSVPDWVMNPKSDAGLAATGCAPLANDMAMSRNMATALARRDLAQKMETRVNAVDKLYSEKTATGSSQHFSQSAELVTDQVLSNTSPDRIEVIELNGQDNVCAMLTLDQKTMKSTFRSIAKGTQLKLSQQQEQELYAEFSDF